MHDYTLAEIAYNAYCQFTGGVSLVSGDKLPPFGKLPEKIQDAWDAAAYAVTTQSPGSQTPTPKS
jgi:hypothetical protein